MKDERLREAAENAYYAWMGGTMNDVREAMRELGEAIEEQKQEVFDTKINGEENNT